MIRRPLLALLILVGLGATTLTPVSSGATPSEHRFAQAVTKVNYPGTGIAITRTSGDERKLEGASRSFKKFVKARLEVLFKEAGSKPRCAASPTVVVDRYHSGGFASAGEGWYGKCPAGGYAVIYKLADDGWQQILGTQEARFCQDLAWWGVPRFIGGSKCLTENFKAIRYRPADTEAASPEATARRVLSLSGGAPILPAEDIIVPAAEAQLEALIDDGAYLTVEECLSDGCEVTATYKKGKKESLMMRMNADLVVTEIVSIA